MRVVIGPGGRREDAGPAQRGGQRRHRVAVVEAGAGLLAVAHADVHGAVRAGDRARGAPHGPLARGRHHVGDQRPAAAERDAHHRAAVRTAVSVQPAERHVHPPGAMASAGRCWSYRGCPSGVGNVALYLDAAVAHRDAHQHVVVSRGLGHGVDQPAGRVVDRRAGDAERVDVAARQVRQRHRGADVPAPDHPPGRLVERVEGVVLGRRDHHGADQQRLAVDRAVQVRPPAHRQRGPAWPRRRPRPSGRSRARRWARPRRDATRRRCHSADRGVVSVLDGGAEPVDVPPPPPAAPLQAAAAARTAPVSTAIASLMFMSPCQTPPTATTPSIVPRNA